jgi:hypothetical protein
MADPKVAPPSAPAPAVTGGGRSVAFPFISLEAAINRARQFWNHEGKNAAPLPAAAADWDYGLKSGALRQTVSAMKQYGLMVDSGSGDAREIKLTDRALDILLEPEDSPKRAASIRAAATGPKIYAELLSKWNPGALPSDATITAYLLREKDFNRNSVADFITDFKANIAFANLSSSANMPLPASGEEGHNQPDLGAGDYVLWLSNGVEQFSPARKLTSLSPDGAYAFVEGSMTGVPVAELTKVAPPAATITQSQQLPGTPPIKPASAGFKQDVFSLDEGQVVIQWPADMSAESFEDFQDWLKLLVKKVGRAYKKDAGE